MLDTNHMIPHRSQIVPKIYIDTENRFKPSGASGVLKPNALRMTINLSHSPVQIPRMKNVRNHAMTGSMMSAPFVSFVMHFTNF